MKERPILFSTPMVQAILEGRKTMTRRMVKNKLLTDVRSTGCFIIFTDIKDYNYEKVDFKTNTNFSKRGLHGWKRWDDLFQNEIQGFWEKGIRGLVSISWSRTKKRIFINIHEPQKCEGYEVCSQTCVHGISRNASIGKLTSKTSGWESEKQHTGEFGVGNSGRELDRQKNSRSRNERGKASTKQADKCGTISHYMGCEKWNSITKTHCEDVGNVTISYQFDLQYCVGLRLWVREAFGTWADEVVYKADNPKGWSFRPSIHMPRRLCRILLEITDVRVERLQDISEEDALNEGITALETVFVSPVERFETLWNKINGPESWKSNPYVWVISFKVINK